MNKYIQRNTVFPDYYQFPKFLMDIPISQTAKLIYMLLYNRARLSQTRGWLKDDRVYLVYPIKNIAHEIRRSETTVKSALNELRSVGLLHSEDGGFSRANHLFVLLPDVPFSDPVENLPMMEVENQPIQGKFSLPDTVGNLPPSNKNKLEDTSKKEIVTTRTALGRYRNVFLSAEEYEALRDDYPDNIDDLIEEMSAYCASKNITYSNYEASLRRWEKNSKQKAISSTKNPSNYHYEKGESF